MLHKGALMNILKEVELNKNGAKGVKLGVEVFTVDEHFRVKFYADSAKEMQDYIRGLPEEQYRFTLTIR